MFSGLNFESQRHLYFIEGVNYPSVSSLVHTHEHPVDFEAKLPACARREGVTVDELRATWRKTNKDACDLGTDTHDFLEHFTGLEQPSNGYEKAGIQFLVDILQDFDIVAKEIRMYSRKYQFAGTSDLLLLHRFSGQLYIADYKTNKDLFKSYDQLRTPFNLLDSSPFNKYQIQLSYYQVMLEEAKLPIAGRKLISLRADGTYKVFDTADFTEDLKEIMDKKRTVYDNNW